MQNTKKNLESNPINLVNYFLTNVNANFGQVSGETKACMRAYRPRERVCKIGGVDFDVTVPKGCPVCEAEWLIRANRA